MKRVWKRLLGEPLLRFRYEFH